MNTYTNSTPQIIKITPVHRPHYLKVSPLGAFLSIDVLLLLITCLAVFSFKSLDLPITLRASLWIASEIFVFKKNR